MLADDPRPATTREWLMAAALIFAGTVIAVLSVVEIQSNERHQQIAQTTPPLQSSPPEAQKESAPAESKPGGTRPTTPAPEPAEPARPDPEAQKKGAPVQPQRPAEKYGPPIKER
jgi:hypothetical protein